MENAGCVFSSLPDIVLYSTDKALEDFAGKISVHFDETAIVSCTDKNGGTKWDREICWTEFNIITLFPPNVTAPEYNNIPINVELFTHPGHFVDENTKYQYFELIVAYPLSRVGLESTTKLFVTYLEYVGSLEEEITYLVRADYPEVFTEFGKGLAGMSAKIAFDTWDIMLDSYYFLDINNPNSTFQTFIDHFKKSTFLSSDEINLLTFAMETVYDLTLDIEHVVWYYSMNDFVIADLSWITQRFYNNSVIQTVVESFGDEDSPLTGDVFQIVECLIEVGKELEVASEQLGLEFADIFSNFENAADFPGAFDAFIDAAMKFSDFLRNIAANIRQEVIEVGDSTGSKYRVVFWNV